MKTPSIRKLEEQIKQLENYFTKVRKLEPSHSRLEKLKEISDKLKKQTYNIAIVANMSAGKSTFINALFGKEILPSSTGATTDCATYIYSSKEDNTEKKAIVHFKDGRPPRHLSQCELDELKHYAKKDEDATEKKYRNVEKIELHHPFKYIPKEERKDDLKISFVDTPGPNNQGQGAEKHSTQTRNAIHNAHAVLFLFDFTQIPATYGKDDNPNDLWSIIKEKKDSNSSFKVFFIINKFDEFLRDAKLWDAVEKKKEDIRKELKETAEEKGIKDAEVFFTAARPALAWRRDETVSDYTRFKEDFKEVYLKSDAAQALNDFMGIDIIENEINDYLSNEAYPKFLEFCQGEILKPIEEELSELEQRIHTLDKEKGDARQNTDRAKEAINNLVEEEQELRKTLEQAKKTAFDKLEQILDKQKQEIEEQAEEIAKNAIFLLNLYIQDPISYKMRENKILNSFERVKESALKLIKEQGTIEAKSQEEAGEAKKLANKYISDCISKILSTHNSDFELIHLKLGVAHNKAIDDFKQKVENKISEALELKNTFNIKKIKSSYRLNFNIMDNLINFQLKRKWHDWLVAIPSFGLFGEGRFITTIEYQDTIESFQKCIKEEMQNFKANQSEKHNEILQESDQQVWEKIEQYKREKKDYIEGLQEDIGNKEEKRKEAIKEKAELTKLQAYEYYKNQGVKS